MVSVQSVLAVVVCSLAIASCTKFTDCGSKEASINSITVPGCDQGPCVFKRGTDVAFSMTFTPSQDVTAVKTKITAYLGPIPIPFSPPDTNSCHFMTCPLSKGKQASYSQKLAVSSSYPAVPSLKVQWELVDDTTGNAVTCFQVDAKVE